MQILGIQFLMFYSLLFYGWPYIYNTYYFKMFIKFQNFRKLVMSQKTLLEKICSKCYIFSSCYHVGNMKRTFQGQFLESKFVFEKINLLQKKGFFFQFFHFFCKSSAFSRNDYSGIHKHEQTIIFIKERKVKINLISKVQGFTNLASPLPQLLISR